MFKGMMKSLTPRSASALAVVAVAFFLMVCIATYGGNAFASLKPGVSPGFAANISGWLVQTIGAGVWALVLLPLAWGVIVYFNERTPDLLMRFAGTVVLAVAISTLVGLAQGGLWAGHLGNAVARSLAALSGPLGGFGTGIAWLLALTLFAVSLLFSTDWMFHELRRAGRTASDAEVEIAVEPAVAELLDDPAEAAPREFVAQTARSAVAAAEMAEIVHETSDEVKTPTGWSELEDEGRTVISAPSGYRGVEFLPQSEELATPEVVRAVRFHANEEAMAETQEIEAEPMFRDEFVATSDAAFFTESAASGDVTDWEAADIGEPIVAPESIEAEPAVAEPESESVVAEAVMTLFAAVTTPEPEAAPAIAPEPVAAAAPAAPASGIGLPEDSPFLDEFFPSDAGWPYASGENPTATDGASAAAEMASAYSGSQGEAAPAPAASETAEPSRVPAETSPELVDEWVAVDEVIVSRLPEESFEDSVLGGSEEPVEAPSPEPVAARETVAESAPVEEEIVIEEPVAMQQVGVAAQPVASEPVPEPLAAPEAPMESPVYAESAPQLALFADAAPSATAAFAEASSAVATLPSIDLARLHSMELDPLFHDAVGAILLRGRASAVVLQRQLGIGYARGIRILDQMTAAGLAGPDTPTGAREIRITRESWAAFTA